ncbi:MAG TPA: hypothetical protein VFX03_02620 [Thermomicrobiales bacterium]|nr:hypothetical protein [Thermomicrobiales bacterium]
MAGFLAFDGTIADSANSDSSVVDLANGESLAVFVKSDKALTGTLYVTPSRPIDDGFSAATADWYKVGDDIAIAANTPNFSVVAITGAGAAKINLANAAGATATATAILRPSARRPVH